MYDVIIIGAGPAGMSAAAYAAKQQLKALVLDESADLSVEKGEGDVQIVAKAFENALKQKPSLLEFRKKAKVVQVEKNVVSFSVELSSGEMLYCRAVVIASGRSAQGEPNANFISSVHKDHNGAVKVDAFMQTNVPGIFAPGDVNFAEGKDAFIAAGEGARALLSADRFLGTQVLQ